MVLSLDTALSMEELLTPFRKTLQYLADLYLRLSQKRFARLWTRQYSQAPHVLDSTTLVVLEFKRESNLSLDTLRSSRGMWIHQESFHRSHSSWDPVQVVLYTHQL